MNATGEDHRGSDVPLARARQLAGVVGRRRYRRVDRARRRELLPAWAALSVTVSDCCLMLLPITAGIGLFAIVSWFAATGGPAPPLLLVIVFGVVVLLAIALLLNIALIALVGSARDDEWFERWGDVRPVGLRLGLCPSCCYQLANNRSEPDGCTVCPECGAAWRLPQVDNNPA